VRSLPHFLWASTHDPRALWARLFRKNAKGTFRLNLTVYSFTTSRLDDGIVEPGLQGLLRAEEAVEVVLHASALKGVPS